MSRRRAWLEVLLLLLIVAVSGLAVGMLGELFAGGLPAPVLLILQGVVIILVLTLLLARAGQGWRDVGLHPMQRGDVGRALLLLITCIGANLLVLLIVFLTAPGPAHEHMNRLQDIAAIVSDGLPFAAVAFTMLFVGVYEELTARGFLLARCLTAFDSVWAPVLVSSALFGLGHIYQGWIGVAQTTVIGVIFAIFTLRWATLWPAIMAHAALNTLSVATLTGVDSPKSVLVFLSH
ncbi:MAG: CPBP family intramembrane glutamic endopeptidase [Thiogranum sp.]